MCRCCLQREPQRAAQKTVVKHFFKEKRGKGQTGSKPLALDKIILNSKKCWSALDLLVAVGYTGSIFQTHPVPNLFYALYYIFTWNNKKNDFWPKTKMCTAKIQDGVSFWPKIEISSFCLRMSKKSDPDEKVYFVQYQVWNILKFFFSFLMTHFWKKKLFQKKIPKNLGRHIYFYFFLIFWSIWHGFNVLRPERA